MGRVARVPLSRTERGTMTARLVLPTLDPEMLAIARDTTRFRVLNAGRRRGKSTAAVVVAADCSWRGGRALWVSPVYRQSEEAFAASKRLLSSVPVVTVRESTREIRFPSGGLIRFASGDAPDNLRGGEGWNLLVGEEWSYAAPELWPTLRPSLAERRGRGLFISTPRMVGDHWHEMVLRGDVTREDRDPEWRSWTLPTSGAPHVAADELEAARRSMPALDYQREFNAEFVSAAGARVRREWLRIEPAPRLAETFQGVDLAVSERATADYTACVTVGRDPDGVVWVLDAERIRAPFHGVCEFIKRKATAWSPRCIAVEDVAFQRGVVTELQRSTALPVKGVRPQGDKLSRLAPLESRIETGVIRFAASLPPWFLDELCSVPAGSHDDGVDAFTLAWSQVARGPVASMAALTAQYRHTFQRTWIDGPRRGQDDDDDWTGASDGRSRT